MPKKHDSTGSLWEATAPAQPDAPTLQGEQRADAVVVGGGYTGLSAALHLAEEGSDVVVLEAQQIGYGGSGRNAGLVNAGLWLAPEVIEARLGSEAGERLNEAFSRSPDVVFSLIERHSIACEATRKGTLHLAHTQAALDKLARRADQLSRLGAPVEVTERDATARMTGTHTYAGALYDPRAGTIQPMGYALGLAHAARRAGARIHCGSPATALTRGHKSWCVATPEGRVAADTIILATNAYTDDLWPGLKRAVIPTHFFQLATEPLGHNVRATILPGGQGTWDTHKVMRSFRMDATGRLILGSIGNLPGGAGAFPRRWAARMAARMFPQVGAQAWTHQWSGRIALTPDRLPRVHMLAPGVFTSLGYNGRGIGPGTIMGKALAEHLLGAPQSSLPVPVSSFHPLAFRNLREAAHEAFFQTFHTGQALR
ncbi:MAG: NAD(P)/FAD-dependent oxidoreductase [Gammaproteobacteria bacterium]